MKNRITSREKVLLTILVLLIIGSMYYLLFYTPTKEKIVNYEAELSEIEDVIILSEVRVTHMEKMQKELDALKIEAGVLNTIKETPLFDNSRKLMESLHVILAAASEYEVSFNSAEVTDRIVRRDVTLNYESVTYSQAKKILQNIHDDRYPCIIKDVRMESNADGEFVYTMVTLTYFEYME